MKNDDGGNAVRIPNSELPDELAQEVRGAIRRHSVSMVASDEDEAKGVPCAGTFVTLGGIAGLLTARQVWQEIRKRKQLVMMVGGRSIRIPTELLTAYFPPGMYSDLFKAEVPDIAFVPLSEGHRETVEAYGKVFYSVDRRGGDDAYDLYGDDGYWVAIGSPEAYLKPDKGAIGSFTYLTDIEKRIEIENWDYLFVNLTIDDNSRMPGDFGGMSGGAIWRAKFVSNADRSKFHIENVYRDILLVGVVFLEMALAGRQLIAHGPRSIYQELRNLVVAARAASSSSRR